MKDKERLVTEWLEHDKAIIAVDYDDTIFPWLHRTQEECDKTIKLIKWCQTIGIHLMIHTCSDEARHDEIMEYCKSKGLEVESINKNPIDLPYGNEGKPYYNWQLCDRSGLEYASKVLEEAAEEVLWIKQKKNNNNINSIA